MNKDLAKQSDRSPDPSPLTDDLEEIAGVVESRIEQSLVRRYAGPLPAPDMLRDYDGVVDNGAERIMVMAEKEQNHRHKWETSALAIENSATKLSLFGGLIVALVLIAGAIYSVYLGHISIAVVFLSGPAIGMVVQILNWRKRRAEGEAEEARNSGDSDERDSRTATLERAESKRSRRRRR